MKKIKIYIGLVLLMGFISTAAINYPATNTPENTVEETGISFFHGTWSEALAKAKAENKLIFVDAYTTWCGPCKWMSRNAFTDAEVGEFFNKNFICVKVDCEKGEGIELARKWKITAYPTLLGIDAAGNVKQRNVGALGADALLSLGKNWAK